MSRIILLSQLCNYMNVLTVEFFISIYLYNYLFIRLYIGLHITQYAKDN